MSKKVLITGASSGIGKALAYEFAKRGYALGLTARRVSILEEIQKDIQSIYAIKIVIQQMDVSNPDDVFAGISSLVADLGGVDIVVANAGIAISNEVGRGKFEMDQMTIQTNLIGAMATVDAAAILFREQGSGQIVGISSIAAFRGLPKNASYCASKAGLDIYLEAVRVELRPYKVEVTTIHPGYIDTPLNESMQKRPFVISSNKGAVQMVNQIEKKHMSTTIPTIPWGIISFLMKFIPDTIWVKLVGKKPKKGSAD